MLAGGAGSAGAGGGGRDAGGSSTLALAVGGGVTALVDGGGVGEGRGRSAVTTPKVARQRTAPKARIATTRFRALAGAAGATTPASVVAPAAKTGSFAGSRLAPVLIRGRSAERGISPPSAAASAAASSLADAKRSSALRAHARWNQASTAAGRLGFVFEGSGSGSEWMRIASPPIVSASNGLRPVSAS